MNPQQVTAAGGVVFSRTGGDGTQLRILTILRNGLWDLPKGKVEPGEAIQEAAVREVVEETGIPTPLRGPLLGVTRHSYVMDAQAFDKQTHWYAMQIDSQPGGTDTASDASLNHEGLPQGTPQAEEGVTRVEWMTLDEAMEHVGFENLRQVLRWFSQWWMVQEQ